MRMLFAPLLATAVWGVTDETPADDVAQECPFDCTMDDSAACPCGYGDDLDPCGSTFTDKFFGLLHDAHVCHITIMNYCCYDDHNDQGCDKVMGLFGENVTKECPKECKDDFLGTFAKHGGCDRLLNSPFVTCDTDLNAVMTSNPETFPRGSLVKYTCPVECQMGGKTCGDVEFHNSSDEEPEPIAPIAFPTAPPLQGDVPHTILEWSRPVEGCGDDREIPRTGMSRVTWAMGHEGRVPKKPKKLTYHKKRGSASIPLLKKRVEMEMPADVRTFDFVMKDVDVHHDIAQHFGDFQTFYYCQTFKLPEWTQDGKKRHILKIEPILTPGNEMKVHHNLMYTCNDLPDSMVGNVMTDMCGFNPNMPPEMGCLFANPIFAVYSIGADTVYYPEEAGYPIGVGYDNKFIMNMHYDNYDFQPFNDASGFRFYVTEELRDHDVGVGQYGGVFGIGIPPGEEAYEVHTRCPAGIECLSESYIGDGITITHSFMHAHLWGKKVKADVVDANGKVLANVGDEPSYDFDLQNIYALPKPFKLEPGMGIDVTCTYNTVGETKMVYGGESTEEEMCLAWLVYWPAMKKKNSGCGYMEMVEGGTFSMTDPTQMNLIGHGNGVSFAMCSVPDMMSNPNLLSVGFTMDREELPTKKCKPPRGDKTAKFGDYGSLSELDAHLASYDYKYTLLHGHMELYWTFHPETGMIDFALDAATDGWAGIGISPTGGMPGSDIAIGWINEKKGKVEFGDYYAEGHIKPKYDKVQSLYNMKATRVIRTHGGDADDRMVVDMEDSSVEIRWVRVVAVVVVFATVAFTISRVWRKSSVPSVEEESLLAA